MNATARRLGPNYAFVVAGVTFLALLVAAGLRSAPSVMLVPLQLGFGWSRATVSSGAALGVLLYGLVGPFAAALMQTLGIRRTMLGGLALMSVATLSSTMMREPWQYLLTWGVLSGLGSGAVASVLGAAVVNRWFATRQGLVMGALTASTATGSLIFLPTMAWLASEGSWRAVAIFVGVGCASLIPLVLWLMPESPAARGHARLGEPADTPAPTVASGRTVGLAFAVLARAVRVPTFWLLFGSFFVCGLTTNGLVGTHLIAYCGDHGIPAVKAAWLLSLMGFFDLIGTTASGWLTDRHDPARLLFVYYGLRGLSLVMLPLLDFGSTSLAVFAVFYGLDWIATVPPTVRLANIHFGPRDAPIVFGWIFAGHQLGAASAAYGAGFIRQVAGSYDPAFFVSGAIGVVTALAVLAGRARLASPAAIAVATPLASQP